jgi:hypothetical protein
VKTKKAVIISQSAIVAEKLAAFVYVQTRPSPSMAGRSALVSTHQSMENRAEQAVISA